jgi:Skp family chaperone for outer membrane proteins
MRRGMLLLVAISVVAAYLQGRASSSGAATDTKNASKAANLPEHVKIAFVDIASIFKRYEKFKAKMDKMKEVVEAEEEKVAADKKRVDEWGERLKDPSLKTGEAEQIRQAIRDSEKTAAEGISAKKAQFMREEGAIYYDTMTEVKRVIEHCCTRNNIQFVLRFNGEPVDPFSREDILRAINSPIPYLDPALNITEEILAELNAGKEAGKQ